MFIYKIITVTLMALSILACKRNQSINHTNDIFEHHTSFFGDSTLTIVSSNRPNGYQVKIFQSKDLILLNLSRGDSINQYVPLYIIPHSLLHNSDFENLIGGDGSVGDSIGTYVREILIPVKKALGHGIFFMDVNFDGEEELLVEHPGYNRNYYACFDIVNGVPNVTPGILHAMRDAPYSNIVTTAYSLDEVGEIGTYFDYTNKTIHISEQIGCCNHIETWCKLIADNEWEKPTVKVVKREEVDYFDGVHHTKIFIRENGELVLKSETMENLN